jgi:hypothetical protein
MGALASGGRPPPKRERPALAGTGTLESNQISAQQISHTDAAWQQQAELAARLIARRHFVRPAVAKIIVSELRLGGCWS